MLLRVIVNGSYAEGGLLMSRGCLLVGLVAFLSLVSGIGGSLPARAADTSAKVVKRAVSTADHSRFKDLDQKFFSGPEVTKACLKCHNMAASQIHDTIHWTWAGRKNDKKGEGKAKTLNNF